MTIGEILRKHRENRGHSQLHVSRCIDVGNDLLSRIENGEREPSLHVLYELASMYNLETYDQLELLTVAGFPISLSTADTLTLLLHKNDILTQENAALKYRIKKQTRRRYAPTLSEFDPKYY